MSVEIWPALPPELVRPAVERTQRLELEWLLNELRETLQNLKSGLEDCYGLLAPVDPGCTLVVSTPRNEIVKGHVTRVGTRIVKGTLTFRLKTLHHQTFNISPSAPILLAPLSTLQTLLNHSIELLTLTLPHITHPSPSPPTPLIPNPPPSPSPSTASFQAAQLRLLSSSLAEATSLLKGPQPSATASDATWVSKSCSPHHFVPAATRHLSLHWGVQDCALVLWLRALEPADAPVALGMKFALAIGTARRIEHDEAEQVFVYTYPEGAAETGEEQRLGTSSGRDGSTKKKTGGSRSGEVQVYVREKVRVESADPSLLSLSAKLIALTNTLALARANLAAAVGDDFEE